MSALDTDRNVEIVPWPSFLRHPAERQSVDVHVGGISVRVELNGHAAAGLKPAPTRTIDPTAMLPTPTVAPPTDGPPKTLGTGLDEWRDERVTFGTSYRNARKQAGRLRTMFDAEQWTSWDVLREDDKARARGRIVAHFNALKAGKESSREDAKECTPVGSKTIETLLSQLTQFCAWAVEKGHLNVNPCSGIRSSKPRKRRKKGITNRRGPRALPDADYEKVYQAALADEQSEEPRFDTPISDLLEVLRWTGGRIGQVTRVVTRDEDGTIKETTGIRWCDCNLESPGAYVIYDGEDSKNGGGWRIPLGRRGLAALRRWRARCETAGPDDLVFPFKWQERWFNAHLEAAGVPKDCPKTGRRASIHSLRKTYCTSLVVAGVAPAVAQKLMQHEDIQTTMKIYAEVRDEQLERGIELIDPASPEESNEKTPIAGFSLDATGGPADTHAAMLLTTSFNEATRPGAEQCQGASLLPAARVRTSGLVGGSDRPSSTTTSQDDATATDRAAIRVRPSAFDPGPRNAATPGVNDGRRSETAPAFAFSGASLPSS